MQGHACLKIASLNALSSLGHSLAFRFNKEDAGYSQKRIKLLQQIVAEEQEAFQKAEEQRQHGKLKFQCKILFKSATYFSRLHLLLRLRSLKVLEP